MWNQESINNHEKACEILDKIKDNAVDFIKNNPNTNELEVEQYIHEEFEKNKMIISKKNPDMIVAFNESCASPHYDPKVSPKKLNPNTLIMIDIFARLVENNSPFSDITWMAYYGNEIPEEIKKVWDIVKESRDACLDYIKSELRKGKMPIGIDIDNVSRQVIIDAGYKENILHTTGHSIGYNSPHGIEPGLSQKNPGELQKNLAYTIEPGIYLKDRFGIRSEICFYINDDNELVVTTKIQDELIKIISE